MSLYILGKITKMPLFPTEITEMPQFILKYIKNAPILIEITEMPQYMRFTEGKSQKCPLFPTEITEMPQFILKYTEFAGYTLGPATKCPQLQIKFGYRVVIGLLTAVNPLVPSVSA